MDPAVIVDIVHPLVCSGPRLLGAANAVIIERLG